MRAGTAAVALAILGGALLCGSARAGEEKLDIRWRWVYSPTNFQVDANVPAVVKLLERARKAGYNGIMIGDWKWGNFENRPARYYENMKKVKAASDRIGIEIVAMVAGVGWSGSILQNNPNMAEGIEVRDCVLAVKDGKATVANRDNILPFGGFEKLRGNGRLDGWSWYDSHGTATVQDAEVFHSGKASVRMSDFDKGEAHRNCRLNKPLKLKPWLQYLLTMWVICLTKLALDN